MRILYLSSWLPYPLRTGSSVTNYNAIKQLANRHKISLVSFVDSQTDLQFAPAMAELCTDVTCVLRGKRSVPRLQRTLGLLSPVPSSVFVARDAEMFEVVARKTAEHKFDCAITDSTSTIEYALQAGRLPRIIFHHNVDSVLAKRQWMLESSRRGRFRSWLTWRKAAAYERRVNRMADAHIMVSEVDKAELLALVPEIERIEVVPNGVDMNSFRIAGLTRQQNSIIFTGLPKYGANIDGLRYFHREIFPTVKQRWNGTILHVTGDFSGMDVADLQTDSSIVFTGYLDDVKNAVASSWISIAPIRLGSGTRLKILESMALGTPVVSTSIGAEGLDVEHERNILIADKPADFAEQILRLRDDDQLWQRLSENGKRLIEERYDWNVLGRKLEAFLNRVSDGFHGTEHARKSVRQPGG